MANVWNTSFILSTSPQMSGTVFDMALLFFKLLWLDLHNFIRAVLKLAWSHLMQRNVWENNWVIHWNVKSTVCSAAFCLVSHSSHLRILLLQVLMLPVSLLLIQYTFRSSLPTATTVASAAGSETASLSAAAAAFIEPRLSLHENTLSDTATEHYEKQWKTAGSLGREIKWNGSYENNGDLALIHYSCILSF